MRRLCLGKAPVWRRLGGVNEIRKLNGVLNEKYRDVVADDVPVALLGVKLDGKPPDVTGEPLLPATVEKRTNAGTRSPARANTSALVISDSDSYVSKNP